MEKIKLFSKYCIESDKGKNIMTVIIVMLVGLGSFGLGRLSKNNNSENTGVKIEYPAQEANVIDNTIDYTQKGDKSVSKTVFDTNGSKSDLVNNNFFASKKGKKYYSIGCSAGKTIKETNKIYFTTEIDAQNAGYSKSTSCK